MSRSARRGDRRSQRHIICIVQNISFLALALLSGCSSASKIRWSDAARPHDSPRPSEGLQAQGKSDLPKRRGRSKPQAAPSGEHKEGDAGLVLTAAEVSSGNTTSGSGLAIPPAAREYPIDLTTALRLAEVENPRIAEVRQRIGEALAIQQGARSLLLPIIQHRHKLSQPYGQSRAVFGADLEPQREIPLFRRWCRGTKGRHDRDSRREYLQPTDRRDLRAVWPLGNTLTGRGSLPRRPPTTSFWKSPSCTSSCWPPRPTSGSGISRPRKKRRSFTSLELMLMRKRVVNLTLSGPRPNSA